MPNAQVQMHGEHYKRAQKPSRRRKKEKTCPKSIFLHRCSAGDVLITLLGRASCARGVPLTRDVLISFLERAGNRAIALQHRRRHRTNGPNEK
ncbi:hypothetical protein M378DRAFT_173810 [Amanita muscaria Koide BX008]|uniref:Uncharacterized protein n=1 Tax=Amanita muscaria (strain Koide BX008) TaxID=946122 RepID=A0A0C2RXY9_AMAMK|nr:hypothetical protein M378DRAFT_173810 [Amanita muscaria Koide BX008]